MNIFEIRKTETYCGRILSGQYGDELQHRVQCLYTALLELDRLDFPVYHYLSAWKEKEKIIWYEYAGNKLITLLGCESAQAADFFRNAIVNWRSYLQVNCLDVEIQEKILTRDELKTARTDLREEVQSKGVVEAVYTRLWQSSI